MTVVETWSEGAALCCLLLLSARVIFEDIRSLEINAWLVLILSGGGVGLSALWPLPGLTPFDALLGAGVGLCLGVLTRFYIKIRTGLPAFGGADIALITGAGGLLGPFLFGPWIFTAALSGLLLAAILPMLGRRVLNLEEGKATVIPFCPALILSAVLFYSLARFGLLPPTGVI